MYKASIIPIDTDDDCSRSYPVVSYDASTGRNTSSDANCGLLIYGGIAGNDGLLTSFGQVVYLVQNINI